MLTGLKKSSEAKTRVNWQNLVSRTMQAQVKCSLLDRQRSKRRPRGKYKVGGTRIRTRDHVINPVMACHNTRFLWDLGKSWIYLSNLHNWSRLRNDRKVCNIWLQFYPIPFVCFSAQWKSNNWKGSIPCQRGLPSLHALRNDILRVTGNCVCCVLPYDPTGDCAKALAVLGS